MTIDKKKNLVAQTGNEYSNLLICNTVMVTVLLLLLNDVPVTD